MPGVTKQDPLSLSLLPSFLLTRGVGAGTFLEIVLNQALEMPRDTTQTVIVSLSLSYRVLLKQSRISIKIKNF